MKEFPDEAEARRHGLGKKDFSKSVETPEDVLSLAMEAAAYLREEAVFNRSCIKWRSTLSGPSPKYKARRIELAEQRERWAAAIELLAGESP